MTHARLPSSDRPPAEATIVSASVGAGHDGEAELIVRLVHPNGAAETVTLDGDLGFHLINICGVNDAAGLAGQPWRKILEGL
jgi:hypothetical protein